MRASHVGRSRHAIRDFGGFPALDAEPGDKAITASKPPVTGIIQAHPANTRTVIRHKAWRHGVGCFGGYSRAARRRRALAMTDTELSDIAKAAITGLSRMPNIG